MRDTSKILRYAIYNALNENISVPVYDEKKKINHAADLFVIFSTQTEQEDNAFGTFINISSIDIEVVHKTGSEVSKDDMDDVVNEILDILFPTASTDGITQPETHSIQNLKLDRSITRVLETSNTESILRRILTITAQIIHN